MISTALRNKLYIVPVVATILLVIYVIFLVADGIYVFAVKKSAPHGLTARIGTARITEDDPGWDCTTMGNGVCGPNVLSDSRYASYDAAFTCFAEIQYTHPRMAWGERVMRCIPPVSNSATSDWGQGGSSSVQKRSSSNLRMSDTG